MFNFIHFRETTMKVDTKWYLCLINEHSCELRCEIKQIYLHMWLYYEKYMEKVDLGVLDTCNRMMGFGQTITETERFYLIIRDDYLMVLVMYYYLYIVCIIIVNYQ